MHSAEDPGSLMNIGRVFEEDGVFKLIVRLGDDSPRVKQFPSFLAMLTDLQSSGLSLDEVSEFCFHGLRPAGKLAQLPGRTGDWLAYLGIALQPLR
jgi:hypothetical protein